MNLSKRFLKGLVTSVMSLALVIGALPILTDTVRADGEVATVGLWDSDESTRTRYTSIKEAFEAAGDCDEITLLDDVELNEDVSLNLGDGEYIYVDLDGHTLNIRSCTVSCPSDGMLKIWSDNNPGSIDVYSSVIDVNMSFNTMDEFESYYTVFNRRLKFYQGRHVNLYDGTVEDLYISLEEDMSLYIGLSWGIKIKNFAVDITVDENGDIPEEFSNLSIFIGQSSFGNDPALQDIGNTSVFSYDSRLIRSEDPGSDYPYVYSYPPCTILTAPQPVDGLTWGSDSYLLTPGTAENGFMVYAVSYGQPTDDPDWKYDIAVGDRPGTYYVYYSAHGNSGYSDAPTYCYVIDVARRPYEIGVMIDNWTQGEPASAPQILDAPEGSQITCEYKVSGASDSTYTTTVPTEAGNYTVRAVFAGDEYYEPSTDTADFTIAPAPASSDVTPVHSTEAGVAGFVERLYTVALGRASDPVGKQDWIDAITLRGNTGAEAARGFLYSPEFLNKQSSNEEFVTVLYRTFFDRDPDQAGFDAWVAALGNGASKEEVIEGFINSTEWANLCLRYGIRGGGTGTPNVEVEPNQATVDFATRLYTTCLGRDADEAGMMAWARQLANQRDTGTGAARGFFFSEEFIGQNVSNSEFVNRLYRTFMGREADRAGFDAWVAQLDAGASRETVFSGFAESAEFTGICASYGIVR